MMITVTTPVSVITYAIIAGDYASSAVSCASALMDLSCETAPI